MRILCASLLLAYASAFTLQPNAFATVKPSTSATEDSAHRNRRATVVHDGKANGKFLST